jgi:hypothetical protein
VALLVLEHQADAQNLIARANFQTRQALHYQQALNRELHEASDHVWDSTKSRIKSVCEPLVEYLLFSGEAELTSRVQGTSGFADDFAWRGPRDRQGRSLRDFDLETRLFKFRCSYLIYSPAFRALPAEARDYVLRRLWEVLSGQDESAKFAHLKADERQVILDILRDTLPDLPESWKRKSDGLRSRRIDTRLSPACGQHLLYNALSHLFGREISCCGVVDVVPLRFRGTGDRVRIGARGLHDECAAAPRRNRADRRRSRPRDRQMCRMPHPPAAFDRS